MASLTGLGGAACPGEWADSRVAPPALLSLGTRGEWREEPHRRRTPGEEQEEPVQGQVLWGDLCMSAWPAVRGKEGAAGQHGRAE